MTETVKSREAKRTEVRRDTLAQIEAQARAANEQRFALQVRNMADAVDKAKKARASGR
jgi:hypothetical protein